MADVLKLDSVVTGIVDKLDHKRLDTDIAYFRKIQTTGENIAKYIFDKISADIDANITRIRIWENRNSYFEHLKEGNKWNLKMQ